MKTLKFLLAVLLLITVSLSLAQDNKTIEYGDVIEFKLDGNTLEYEFEAKAGDWVTITLEAEDFDALLGLEDPSGEEFARDDDSAGNRNSRLTLSLAETGTYTILVKSLDGEGEGEFVLRLTQIEIMELAYDEEFEGEFENETEKFFSFQAKAGDTVNIQVTTRERDSIDTKLALKRPDGSDAATDDDTGANYDPYLRRYTLEEEGNYVIQLVPLSGEPIEGEFSIVVETTERLALSSTPITVTLDEDLGIENMVYMVETEGIYRLMVDPVDENISFTVDIRQADGSVSYLSATGTQVLLDFEVPDTGYVSINLSSYATDELEFKVSMVSAE
ncbi:MAG: PPC domain-containing protein [Anaerolineae bacterium]|nr:PPC domain-containing protein [Anaerolineae bacterium]